MTWSDDELRRALRELAPSQADAHAVLDELKPRMRRARRHRRVGIVALSGFVVGGGVAGAISLIDISGTTRLVVTDSGPSASEIDDDVLSTAVEVPTPTDPAVGDTRGTSPVASSEATEVTEPAGSVVTSEPDDDGSDTSAVVTPPDTSEPVVTPPTTASTVSTQPPAPQRYDIVSDCGSITVTFDSATVRLVATLPNPGFVTDVKGDGPREVEVGFADRVDECELKAWVDNGTLRQSVDNHRNDD
jgi:cytoskeletal protein RodZ